MTSNSYQIIQLLLENSDFSNNLIKEKKDSVTEPSAMASFKVSHLFYLYSWWYDPYLLEWHHSRPIWSNFICYKRPLLRTESTACQFIVVLIIHKKHLKWNSTIKSTSPASTKAMAESKTVHYWKTGNHNTPLKLFSKNSKKKWSLIRNSHNPLKVPLIE